MGFGAIGDMSLDDGACYECGAELLGSFTVDWVDEDGVATVSEYAGCYACLIFELLMGDEHVD
jgi:hypothetical protein